MLGTRLTLLVSLSLAVANGGCDAQTPTRRTPAPVFVVGYLQRVGSAGQGSLGSRRARIEHIKALGFTGSRVGFEWPSIEPRDGEYRWSRTDSIVDELASAGLETLGMIGYSPAWARPSGAPAVHRPELAGSAARGDTAFASFAATVARRYRGRVMAWEIWNEPNLAMFWQNTLNGRNSGPRPEDYASLFQLAQDSIHAADPRAVVISGGLAAREGLDAYVRDPLNDARQLRVLSPATYLSRLLTAGVKPDGVGIHPYSNHPPGVRGLRQRVPVFPDLVIDTLVSMLDRHGARTTQLWVTEWGVEQTGLRTYNYVSGWAAAGIRVLRCNPRVALVTVYALYATRPDPAGYSLLDSTGKPTSVGTGIERAIAGGSCG